MRLANSLAPLAFRIISGYINRMRGYHSQKNREVGYEKGIINSYYYTGAWEKHLMRSYEAIDEPMWAREFPVAWRDIDHDIGSSFVAEQ